MLRIPINEQGSGLFFQLIRHFVRSPSGPRAIALFGLLIALLFGLNGLNILNSYVGRDFMSALAGRDVPAYLRQAVIYTAVFACLTVVAVFLRYAEERLGLLWREWMTRQFLDLYLRYPSYYRMNDSLIKSTGMEHADQRIAEDVRVFTTTTLSFALMLLNGTFTALAFSGVLWSISPRLFLVAVVYAAFGSYLTFRLGHRLIDLNYTQLDKEASFRSGLLHVGERAESIALLNREERMSRRLHRQFDAVVENFHQIILVNRRLGFFTTGYNYLVQVIPILLVAPLFIDGQAEFGVITQSAAAFVMLIGAFSLIITQFQSLSSFAAVIERLINLWYAIELTQTETVCGMDFGEDDDRIGYEHLTLRSPIDHTVLVDDLTLSIPHGTRVLVAGADGTAKDALFKATAGILDTGTGRLIRPRAGRIQFLPERPYLPPGSLREALNPDAPGIAITDTALLETLHALGLEPVLARVGGLEAEQDWDAALSVDEQQLMSFARVLLAQPRFVLIENPGNDLDPDKAGELLRMLTGRGTTYLTFGRHGQRDGDEPIERYDAVLELKPQGRWSWKDNGRRLLGPGDRPLTPQAPPP
ncbi:putative ATP-binding cassette transporter [Methylomagnum ishizawai]|uniref:Putative ATP-binding cassette transporter n=1 Tax=Methylomagnum ishizawai TaxID=1760988 RepID=A0A1Y6D1T4_9GAMM|nr:SbmA/BacA-like family transporter [Methylomagnum ishizawai]SMF96546.1 putative ATP-binding cassette transporter [Methylomagnum ishizawai]